MTQGNMTEWDIRSWCSSIKAIMSAQSQFGTRPDMTTDVSHMAKLQQTKQTNLSNGTSA